MSRTDDSPLRVNILAVTTSECDLSLLTRILNHTTWKLETADCCSAAARRLTEEPAPVIVCDQTLPDGDWKAVFAAMRELSSGSHLVVACEQADERLWEEVLNLGAYDVLAKPFRSEEVFHTLGAAWRQSMDKRRAGSSAAPRQTAASYYATGTTG